MDAALTLPSLYRLRQIFQPQPATAPSSVCRVHGPAEQEARISLLHAGTEIPTFAPVSGDNPELPPPLPPRPIVSPKAALQQPPSTTLHHKAAERLSGCRLGWSHAWPQHRWAASVIYYIFVLLVLFVCKENFWWNLRNGVNKVKYPDTPLDFGACPAGVWASI